MEYAAYVRREGRHLLADFPDCPGCQTFARDEKALEAAAREALGGWLEAHLVDGQVPSRPRTRRRPRSGARLWQVPVAPALAISLQIRWLRHEAGLSQADLARRAGVSQQQIAKLERPGENPTIATLIRLANALRARLNVHLELEPDATREEPH